ncbi:MAG: hypothetical protein K6A35_10620 [bacterium]|nr:hypothetical protein [bacterium]
MDITINELDQLAGMLSPFRVDTPGSLSQLVFFCVMCSAECAYGSSDSSNDPYNPYDCPVLIQDW